jgi:hypothetical protein
MEDRRAAIRVDEESLKDAERSARSLDRLERRSVEQTVRGEHARVAKQAAVTAEAERVPGEVCHPTAGFLDQ